MLPSIYPPTCPHCWTPMRLLRVLPRIGDNSPFETQTFRCSKCRMINTRTVRLGADEAAAK
jgi:hypothetical protein